MIAALLWLAVALPLIAAVIVRLAPAAAAAAPLGALLAALPAWILLGIAAGGDIASSGLTWLPAAGLDVGLQLDGLAAAMAATVATVGLIVIVYAGGYFDADPRRRSALAGLLAFLAAMQGLVLADGYLTLLIFWELVGAASARLIALSREDPAAAPGAVRAFLTTRGADIGLYLAVLALFTATGALAFTSERPAGALGSVVAIGLIAAAIGKSAQVPLQTWLSAAMAGPTPVSALLHSATMVAAGVYLLVRSEGLLAGWPLDLVGWIGGITAVLAAGIALAQSDLKRVLAASTTSQLGLMLVGLAAGGPAVAMFQLIAHAFGKAGMFLAAGIFQRNQGTTSLAGLRGAGRRDQAAFAGFAVCALSIAAIPPLAAFWSKDHIAAAAEDAKLAWFVLVLVAAAGSSAYLLRPALLLWRGERRGAIGTTGRRRMLLGVGALVFGSLTLGFLGSPLSSLLDAPELPASNTSLLLSLAAALAGAIAVLVKARVPDRLAIVFRRQLLTDELLSAVVTRPLLAFAAASDLIDRRALDAAVDGVGRGTVVLARAQDWIERRAIDAAVDGLANRVSDGGDDLRRLQSGRLYEYLRDAMIGALAIVILIALTALT